MRADKFFLAPYWWALSLRHFFYDKGWKKVRHSPVPTLCVGNLAVGGTGKTPFTEMLLRHFAAAKGKSKEGVAVLSKGYGRESRGFLYVQPDGTPKDFGDEPLQIKRKFPDVSVAVCSNRVEGCRKMAEDGARRIILDDAFQFRGLEADCNIVLIEYARPLCKDRLLPLGRLRDLPSRIAAADIVIASKCPDDLTEEERAEWIRTLGLKDAYDASADASAGKPSESEAGSKASAAAEKGTPVFFTTFCYPDPEAVFPEGDRHFLYSKKMIVITGIANDKPMLEQLRLRYRAVSHLCFPDHHEFTPTDLRAIGYAAEKCPEAILITTEKDMQRLLPLGEQLSDSLHRRLFYLPVETHFLSPDDDTAFFKLLP